MLAILTFTTFLLASKYLLVFGSFSLSSDPCLHDGKEVCPDSSIKLICEATNTTIETLYWFVEANATYSGSSDSFIAAITVIGSTEVLNSLPHGIEVYLTSFSQMNGKLTYTSTLYVNTSSYDGREIRYISCGDFANRSHWMKLNFTIRYPVPPVVNTLLATYQDLLIQTIIANWRHGYSNNSQYTNCSYVYIVELTSGRENSTQLQDFHKVPFSDCDGQECSIAFRLPMSADTTSTYNVVVSATDRLQQYNTTAVSFEATVAASVVDKINYTVHAVNCSSVYFTCWTSIPNINNCTLSYRVNKSDDESSVQLLPVNSTVALMAHITAFELYIFMLSVTTENESLTYQILGTFTWKPSDDPLSPVNQGILSVGVIMYVVVLALIVLDGFLLKETFSKVPSVLKAILVSSVSQQLVLIVVVLALYIATGAVVSQQDVCDISWKAQRDGLIIAVFVLALYMFMVSVGLSLLLLYINYKECLYNFYYSRKKSSPLTKTPRNQEIKKNEDDDEQECHDEYYNMKKNQLYRPENFDRPEDVEYKGQMKQEGMYDLPEDPLEKSCPTIPEGEKGQIYDDVENTPSPYTMLDIDTVTVASIYNLPDEEVSIKGGEKTEEKFYESIEDEDSNDEATKGKDKGLHWRGNLLQQEINELQIKEANQRRRLEVMQSKSSDVKVDFVKVDVREDTEKKKWLYDSSD